MKRVLLLALVLLPQMTWGALPPGSFITSGPTQDKKIALTFDDGPGLESEQFLPLLDKYQVKATFFMLAEQAKLRPKIARQIADKGHEIGSHTYNHVNYLKHYRDLVKTSGSEDKAAAQAKKDLVEDMNKSRKIIEEATGQRLKVLRMPHGIDRPWIKEAARETGFVLVNWTYGSDWVKQDDEKSRREYINAVKPGAILLFHDGGRNRKKSIALTEAVLKYAKENGFEVVSVGELLGL
jgi:peptidoglycan-N-acetylglucosamine deacetylase